MSSIPGVSPFTAAEVGSLAVGTQGVGVTFICLTTCTFINICKKIKPNTSDHSQNTSDISQRSSNKFEVNMYTTMMSNAIAAKSWFYNMYIQSRKNTETNFSFKIGDHFPFG